MKFRLNQVFEGAIERLVMCTGKVQNTESYKRMTFLPGKVYNLTDPIAIKYIKGEIGDCREKMIATPALKSTLEAAGIHYDIKKCGTCSNAKPKAFFNPFEILEDE